VGKKGILILSLGSPEYGKMAYTLAMSLRFGSNIPISLAYTKSAITHISNKLHFFDKLIEVPEEYYTRKVYKEYIKAKTHICDLSPYDETLYLDADTIWLPKRPVDNVFEDLKGEELAIQCKGFTKIGEHHVNKNYWCDLNEYKKVYGMDTFYNFASEFIYFKKTKAVKKFFKDSSKIYDNLKIGYTVFSGGIPDELIFNISMAQNNMKPFKEVYVPIYWEQSERKNLKRSDMYEMFYAYSVGGKLSSSIEKKVYKDLSQYYGNHFGLQHYELKDKMRYLPERANL
jgi:hypothetical protein